METLHIFRVLAPHAEVELASDFQHLRELAKKRVPDLILVHQTDIGAGNMHCLKDLRKNNDIDEVPILIFPVLPGKEEIRYLLYTINDTRGGMAGRDIFR